MQAASVPGRSAESLRRELHTLGLVDRTLRMEKRDGRVLIPLRAAPPFDLGPFGATLVEVDDLVPRAPARNPAHEVRERLVQAGIPPEAIPTRWERIGDVIVLRLPETGKSYASAIASAFAEVLGAQTVVEDLSGIHGALREPEVRVLWGRTTETTHVEGGVRYRLDVSRVMFSSGNVGERLAAPRLVRAGDVVVDLFAGIGYFTLPIAVHARPVTVYACELNPVAFRFLLENVRLNRVTNVVPLLGDCRDTAPEGVADLVLLGHFDSPRYLDVAFRALRGAGTVVVHELVPKERYPAETVLRVTAAAQAAWYEVTGTRSRIVKSYAPGIVHAVVEARVRRRPKGTVTPRP